MNRSFIEKHNEFKTSSTLSSLPLDIFFDDHQQAIHENPANYEEPVIRFVDNLIQHAMDQKASDIHIEPGEFNSRIRYRRDGLLYEITHIPKPLAMRAVTRLKVMAKLDIAERRLPQDGRIQRLNLDIRISTCPLLYGEKIVLRLLNYLSHTLTLEQLGFTENQKNIFLKKMYAPQGLILVTGPTGSGKTVTLYSALKHLNSAEKNISTVEDPVEIQIPGINQVNINSKIGLEFSTVLRTLLRQDPDIIMIGEIRDSETAKIAMQAAQTGHLVFSTLHTNNTIETLIRLNSMGIAAHNIISSISLIIAQRLIRKLCENCKQPEELDYFSKPTHYKAVGCQLCLYGYKDRTAIYEFLPITDTLSTVLLNENNLAQLSQLATIEGFSSLHDEGLKRVDAGITSHAEINRVL